MKKGTTMNPFAGAAMVSRFVEFARHKVATAMALLSHPTPDVASTISADLHRIGGEAAMLNQPELAKTAREGEAAALQLVQGQSAGLVPCMRALRRLGYLLQELFENESRNATLTPGVKSKGACRLLIVDDSQVAALALSEVFESHGFDVRVASTLRDVKNLLVNFAPNLLVTDVHMPGIEVAEVCKLFRDSAKHRKVAIVLVSGRSESELRDRVEAIHADGFVSKLAGTGAVVAKVAALVQELGS